MVGQQEHREHLVHAAQPARVDLAVVDRAGLQELLEDDAVRGVLAGRHADRCDRAPDRRVPEDVVGARRLLDPAEVERLQVPHPLDRLTDVPHLVRVGHERQVPDLLPHHLAAPDVGRDVDTDLGLEAPPPVGQCGARQVAHLRLGVPEPARRREVRRIPVALQLGDPRRPWSGASARNRSSASSRSSTSLR